MNYFGPEGSKAIASGIAGSASLTRLDISNNLLKAEGVKVVRDAVRGRKGFALVDDDND